MILTYPNTAICPKDTRKSVKRRSTVNIGRLNKEGRQLALENAVYDIFTQELTLMSLCFPDQILS